MSSMRADLEFDFGLDTPSTFSVHWFSNIRQFEKLMSLCDRVMVYFILSVLS